MTLKTLITAILITCMLALCNKTAITTSKYKGNWEGVYFGVVDSGSFVFNIDINGLVKGHINSNATSNIFEVIGTVNSNGVLNLPLGNPASGGSFSGKGGSMPGRPGARGPGRVPVGSGPRRCSKGRLGAPPGPAERGGNVLPVVGCCGRIGWPGRGPPAGR